nr:rRNA maturation RNase YbeY [uncultured Desulfovibrio sp.]
MSVEILIHDAAYVWLCDLDKRQLRQALERMQAEVARRGHAVPALTLHLVDDGAMARCNRRHMGCSGPTNVLSFPGDDALPGQLVFSLPTWQRECLLYGQGGREHLLRLLAHGMGHLAGLDHGPEMDALSGACLRAGSAALSAGDAGTPS